MHGRRRAECHESATRRARHGTTADSANNADTDEGDPDKNCDRSVLRPPSAIHICKSLLPKQAFLIWNHEVTKGTRKEPKSILGALRVLVVENPLVAAQGPRYAIRAISEIRG